MSIPPRRKSAVVVGAGAGGVAVAARLAQEGYQTSLYERNSFTGGRCSIINDGDYRFDRGPSLLLIPELFHQTFIDLGTTLEAEGVRLLRSDPNYLLHFSDGSSMNLSTDNAVMSSEIERFEGVGSFDRYLAFLREAHTHFTLSLHHVLLRPFSSFLALLRPSFFLRVLQMHPLESMYSRAARYFRSEHLRRAMTFGSMYMGMSPFEAPATYSLLQYAELTRGIWYPEGGFHAVIAALVRVGERKGVKYHLSTRVESIIVDPRTQEAAGVVLAGGEEIRADVVVINADLVTAYSTLLPHSVPSIKAYAASLQQRRTSCSSLSFYWGLSANTAAALSTHNIFLAEHYRESFDQIFRDNKLPDQPSFYIHAPARTDPTACPADKDALVVLVPCGHLRPGQSAEAERETWVSIASQVRAKVLATVKARTGLALDGLIVKEQFNTPATWATDLALDRGAILGLSHDFFSMLSFRPRMKARGVSRGCWFVGASTHPGTGVPVVLAGAKVLVEEILRDEAKRTRRWRAVQAKSYQWALEEWRRVFQGRGDGSASQGNRDLQQRRDLKEGSVSSAVVIIVSLLLVGLAVSMMAPQ